MLRTRPASPRLERETFFTLSTRGSLADQVQFVEAVRRLPWKDPLGRTPAPNLPEPAFGSRRVVFAGDVPGGRWAMVVGTVDGELLAAWFAGSSGAAADELRVQDVPHAIDADAPVAFTRATTDEETLVVIAAPGDLIEVSYRAVLSAAGIVSREYQRVQAIDGVAVVDLSRIAPFARGSASVRVVRDTAEVFRGRPEISGSAAATATPELVQVRPGATEEDLQTAMTSLDLTTEPFGLAPEEMEAALLWAGDVPSVFSSPARVNVVGVTVPSGAVIVFADWETPIDDAGTRAGSRCMLEAFPGGVAATEQLIAARCELTVADPGAASATVSSLVIVGPPTAVEARLLAADGSDIATIPLVDGVGTPTAVDAMATVLAVDADGGVVAEAEVSTYEGGDWGDYGAGRVN